MVREPPYYPAGVIHRRLPRTDTRFVSNTSGIEDLTTLSDRDLTRLMTQLERDAQSVSRRRTKLHERIDFVRSGGFASAEPGQDPLEELVEEEREISARRLELHYRIDTIRAERSRRHLNH